jgi:hypothetical protein
MKPARLSTPDRDVGRPSIQPLVGRILDRMEALERRLATKDGGPAAMLSAEREMLAKLDMRAGDAVSLERKRVLQRVADEMYFKVPIDAGNCFFELGAAANGNGNAIVMAMPNAGPTTVGRQVDGRNLWTGTRPKMEIWYSSPVGAVATFDLTFDVRCFAAGATTAGTLLQVAWSAPGPAAAGDIVKTQAVITSGRLPRAEVVRVRLVRSGTDANANNLDVLLALVTFEEVA